MKQDKMIALINTALGVLCGGGAWYASKLFGSEISLIASAAIAALLRYVIKTKLKPQKTAIWLFAFVLLLTWTFLFNVLA